MGLPCYLLGTPAWPRQMRSLLCLGSSVQGRGTRGVQRKRVGEKRCTNSESRAERKARGEERCQKGIQESFSRMSASSRPRKHSYQFHFSPTCCEARLILQIHQSAKLCSELVWSSRMRAALSGSQHSQTGCSAMGRAWVLEEDGPGIKSWLHHLPL